MITRQGTVGQHRLQRLAEQRHPGPARRERHDDRPRVDLLRLLDDPASGLARAHLLPVAGDAAPPRTRAESIKEAALASWSGIEASIGELGGTVIVTSTWMPLRRRAAKRAAVATASGE